MILRVIQKIFFAALNPNFISAKEYCLLKEQVSPAPVGRSVEIPRHPLVIRDATVMEKIVLASLIFVLIGLGIWPAVLIDIINLSVTVVANKIGGLV